MNAIIDKFLRNILWLWLPFVAFYRLTREFINKKK